VGHIKIKARTDARKTDITAERDGEERKSSDLRFSGTK
jgi:hypothetical protein